MIESTTTSITRMCLCVNEKQKKAATQRGTELLQSKHEITMN